MALYKVIGRIDVDVIVTVEAESEEDALDKCEDNVTVLVKHAGACDVVKIGE